jgi:hypothetical protein
LIRLATLLVVLAAFLVAVAPASADTTILEPAGSDFPYQQWIDESAVPTPDVTIEVISSEVGHGCPDRVLDYVACTAPSEGKIWIDETAAGEGHPRETFMHEMGHNFDADVLPEWARERFDALYDLGGPWVVFAEPEPKSPDEWFADVYAQCAILPYVSREAVHSLGVGPISGGEPIGGRREIHNKVCRMLQSL